MVQFFALIIHKMEIIRQRKILIIGDGKYPSVSFADTSPSRGRGGLEILLRRHLPLHKGRPEPEKVPLVGELRSNSQGGVSGADGGKKIYLFHACGSAFSSPSIQFHRCWINSRKNSTWDAWVVRWTIL